MPDWTEIAVPTPLAWHELVAGKLAEGPCTTAVFGPASLASEELPPGVDWVRCYLDEESDTEATRAWITETLDGLRSAVGEDEIGTLQPRFRKLPAEDWANSWKKTWKPFRVGHLCVVTPEWSKPLRATDRRLDLEPGGAFGTGRHCTTRRCLQTIQERLAPGERVLDAGCGSGILSVAAALLGAGSVVGFDIDRVAARASLELAERNGVAAKCDFRTGGFEVLRPEDGPFDALTANLYSDLLQAHAGDLAANLRPGGWFAFSGCPRHHAAETRAAIEAAGLTVEREERRGRWVSYIGTR